MTKRSSVIFLSIIGVIVLFFGVFTFMPVTIEYGKYNEYYSPLTLIQKSNSFTDSVEVRYFLDEEADFNSVKSVISNRLKKAYGYYNVSITKDENELVIVIPETSNNENATATSILGNVTANGKIELLSSSSQSYDPANVILDSEGFASAKLYHYNGDNYDLYCCQIMLTKEAQKTFSASQCYVAVDETLKYYGQPQGGSILVQAENKEQAKLLVQYVNKGVLGTELTLNQTFTVNDDDLEEGKLAELKGGFTVAYIIMAVIMVASIVFFAVRYKFVGIAGILSQLIVSILGVVVAGYLSCEMFNVGAYIGLILSYLFMTFFTFFAFEKIRAYSMDKPFGSAKHKGFADANKLNLIAHGALLVLGIILWVIPTAVTAPIGNIFVYGAVLSFIATMGLNRLFVNVVAPLVETKANSKR